VNCGSDDEAIRHFKTASELEPGEGTFEAYFDPMGY